MGDQQYLGLVPKNLLRPSPSPIDCRSCAQQRLKGHRGGGQLASTRSKRIVLLTRVDGPAHEKSKDPAEKYSDTESIEHTTARGGEIPESVRASSLERPRVMEKTVESIRV